MRKKEMYMDDYIAVLLARADCKDNPAALAVCDMWLKMFPPKKEPSFIELSQPSED